MSRILNRTVQTAIDLLVLSLAYWGAFFLRFDGVPPLGLLKRLLFTWPYVVAMQFAALYLFAVPHFAWRYISLREVLRVLWALGVSALVLLVARIGLHAHDPFGGYGVYGQIPIGVIVGNLVLALVGVTGVRALRRLLGERAAALGLRRTAPPRVRTLLVGAGQAGLLVAKELRARPDLGLEAVGFLDDDPVKQGSIIHGLRVLGPTEDLAYHAARTGARQVLITIAAASGQAVRRIVRACERVGLAVKVVPGLFEILDGQVNLSRIRPVSIEDLLRREPVTLDLELIRGFLQGKRVLVTGAGGSIGSELCRQVARYQPEALVLVEQSEYALFTIHQELCTSFPGITALPRICDVCDSRRLEQVFAESRPEVVFHAAAHKHVPMMEWNPGEAIKNNVFGTQKVAEAAHRFGSNAFVLISTDKAVNPTSVMGATKRVAELVVQALSARSSTKYVAVRFGNVLGSTGSVVPVFQQQIAAGGPVTVTHPEMRRYFMTISEACQLVMQAAAMGRGGEIFVLDMGEPVRIVELAEDLIRLSGLEPGRDIEIRFTGVRPGEKLFEEFGFDAERMSRTAHSKIYVGKLAPVRPETVREILEYLESYTGSSSLGEVRAALRRVVPEMREPESLPGSATQAPGCARGEPVAEPAVEPSLA